MGWQVRFFCYRIKRLKMYYQSNRIEQYSSKRWEIVQDTQVLQLSLERRDLSRE